MSYRIHVKIRGKRYNLPKWIQRRLPVKFERWCIAANVCSTALDGDFESAHVTQLSSGQIKIRLKTKDAPMVE
ncbi:hypothetical protein KAR91_42265 [Candidatus Pacearchaeota archaeon]|nr:hypothetical protein [Candidatus Pacearchaeota archaeon]